MRKAVLRETSYLPTEIEAMYPKEVVDAWWFVKTYARHIPNGGGSTHGDVQTLDTCPDSIFQPMLDHLAVLRKVGLLKEKLFQPRRKEFRRGEGNFVVLDLSAQHARRLKW